jgi:predicted  nucleic acid-binding Zn-ribbon protein
VTLVGNQELKEEETGVLRYMEPDGGSETEEEWHFSADEIREIQDGLEENEDPFSQETNQEFMKKYQKCRRNEEDVGYE